MSIVATQKIHILSLQQHKDDILKKLRQSELVDIQSVGRELAAPPEELNQHECDLAEIKSAITFLESVVQQKKGLVESFAPQKAEISQAELSQTCREFDCPDLVEKCKDIEHRLANLKNLKHEIHSEHDRLLPWRSLDVPLADLNSTAKTIIIPGSIKTRHLARLKEQLSAIDTATEIVIASQTKDLTYLIIFCLCSKSSEIGSLLAKVDLTPIDLPKSERNAAGELEHLAGLLKKAGAEIAENMADAKHLAHHLLKLKYMYDHILEAKTALETKQKLFDTNYTFVIEGWIKQVDLKKLKALLAGITDEFAITEIEPARGEKHPVALHNPVPFSPFELITKIYGTPKYEEFDPSIPLAFFFALFFGICLGDFGYGLILAGVSAYFLKKYKLPEGGRNLYKLLMFGGFVAAVVGILTGSYLGFSPKDMPQALLLIKEILLSVQVIDPIKSPLVMLLFSLALGVVQILFGIILQMALRIRNKEYVAAVLDDGLWLFFLSSLVFLIVATGISSPLAGLAGKMSLAGAGSLVLTQGRHKKNIVQKFLSGLLSLYKISGYMGDTLSYSRLLALGMSSAIIGSVINILAGMVKEVPVLGIALMIVLLIFGHIFNLVISTLSAFVHSTRLQMVEFFSKFYEGGGREFRPYKRQAEYTILK